MQVLSEEQQIERTMRLLGEEIQVFAANGISAYEDDLRYAVWLRQQIELNQSLLNLLHRGEIHVEDLDPENMEATNLVAAEI